MMVDKKTEALPLKRFIIAGTIAALVMTSLVIGSNTVLNNLIVSSQSDAVEINISGRQRMLLQKVANLAQDMVMFPAERSHFRQDLLSTLGLLEASHHGLIDGDSEMGLAGGLSPQLKDMFFGEGWRVDEQISLILHAGRALAQVDKLNADTPELLLIHGLADNGLTLGLDAIVKQYQQEAEAKVSNLRHTGFVISILFILTIMLIGLFIFWPVVRAIRRSASILAASEKLNRIIVESMIDGLITIDQQGTVQSFNRAAEQIFAYQADEVIGNNINMLMPEPYHSGHDGYLSHYMSTGEKKIIGIGREVKGRRKDGSTFPMSLGVSETKLGDGGSLFSGVVRDISAQKQVEAAIAAKNSEIAVRNRYEASYGSAVSLFSESFDQKEMLAGTLDVLARQHPFPASAIYIYDEWSGQLALAADHGIPRALPQSFKFGEGIVGQVLKDGRTVTLEDMEDVKILSIDTGLLSFSPTAVIASPILFQDKVLAVLILASSKPLIDLDQLFIERLSKQLGVALNNLTQHQALTDLAAQLKTHSEEIKEKNAQLEQASRMKSEFLANMSHELRTPLNAIIGFSEILKDGIIGKLKKEQQDYVADIFTSGKHLLSLINDILDLSKIEAGKMELDIELVNVTDMLRNSVSIIKEKAAAHHIKLDCHFDDSLRVSYFDGRKIKQVLYNLLSNAVKFSADGDQVTIRASKVTAQSVMEDREPGQITPMSPLIEDTEYMEITVSDSGIGIAEEDKERLFMPFQQLESTLTKTYEGTGLGLMMVRRLVELHGGIVGVKSKLGEGSTFAIWLPYHESKEQAVATISRVDLAETRLHTDGYSHNVLIIEDDEKAANLMRLELEEAGYVTRHAISAEQALEMIAQELPDLITLDILLPGMDGWDFLAQINKRQDTAHIPVVVVSIVADSNRGFSLGAADVLQKPVQRQALLNALGSLDFSLENKQVLVVDDDPKSVELVSRHLSSVGCDVLKAYSGREAIELASEQRPDLIILDLMMPKMSGFDVVDKLRRDPVLARIPIMILTAKVLSEEDRRRLNGDIVKIMQKSSFNHGNFISEVNRATHPKQMKS